VRVGVLVLAVCVCVTTLKIVTNSCGLQKRINLHLTGAIECRKGEKTENLWLQLRFEALVSKKIFKKYRLQSRKNIKKYM